MFAFFCIPTHFPSVVFVLNLKTEVIKAPSELDRDGVWINNNVGWS